MGRIGFLFTHTGNQHSCYHNDASLCLTEKGRKNIIKIFALEVYEKDSYSNT